VLDGLDDELERILNEVVSDLKYYPSIYLEGVRKTVRNLKSGWSCPRWNPN
jgi:hypothetical protein